MAVKCIGVGNWNYVWEMSAYTLHFLYFWKNDHRKHSSYGFDFQVYYSVAWTLYKEQEQFNQREMTYVFVLRGLFQFKKLNPN